jgi:hypothetical protein
MVSAALFLEILRALLVVERVKFRGLLINGDFPFTYFGSNRVSDAEQLTNIVSLRESREETCLYCILHITCIKAFMSNNNADTISEEVLKCLDGEIKLKAYLIAYVKRKPDRT